MKFIVFTNHDIFCEKLLFIQRLVTNITRWLLIRTFGLNSRRWKQFVLTDTDFPVFIPGLLVFKS